MKLKGYQKRLMKKISKMSPEQRASFGIHIPEEKIQEAQIIKEEVKPIEEKQETIVPKKQDSLFKKIKGWFK
jgi:hypothetical protein